MKLKYLRAALIIAPLLFFCMLISKPYFFLDEPNILWEIKKGSVWTKYFDRFISEGRPFYGWIQLRFLEMAGSMQGMWILRITSILLSLLFLFQVFRFLCRERFPEETAFLYTVLTFCLPGFSLFMMWSECFPQHISSLVSFAAGSLTLRVFAWMLKGERISRTRENLFIVSAVVLQVLSLLNYQGMALVFILPGFFALLLNPGAEPRLRMRFLFYYLITFFAALAVYYTIYKSMLAQQHIEMVGRGKMGHDYIGKAWWFLEIGLKASTLHLFLFKPFLIQRLLSLFIFFLLLRDAYKKRWMDLFFLVAFSVLSFLPHLLIAESWGATRNFVLMGMIILFYTVLRSSELLPFLKKPFSMVLTLPFIALLFVNGYYAFLKPVEEDYHFVYSKVKELPVLQQDSLAIQVKVPVYNMHEKTSFLRSYCDEFNVSPLHYEWPVAPSIKNFYSELHPEIAPARIEQLVKVETKDTVIRANYLYWDYNYK
jgi:hypothetical protein